VRRKSTAKPTPLQPLPMVDQPNQSIHIDLFGPLKKSEQGNARVLVMTNAFTKYGKQLPFQTSRLKQWQWKYLFIGFVGLDLQ